MTPQEEKNRIDQKQASEQNLAYSSHQPSKEECCPKCYVSELLSGDLSGNEFTPVSPAYCSNDFCECHSPSKDSTVGWSEEFDEFLDSVKVVRMGGIFNGESPIQFENDRIVWERMRDQLREPIKSFIKSLLSNQLEEMKSAVENIPMYIQDTGRPITHIMDGSTLIRKKDVIDLLTSLSK